MKLSMRSSSSSALLQSCVTVVLMNVPLLPVAKAAETVEPALTQAPTGQVWQKVSVEEERLKESSYGNGIVAVVAGPKGEPNRVITTEQLNREIAPLLPQLQRQATSEEDFNRRLAELRQQVLQTLVDRALILSEFHRMKAHIPQTAVKSHFQEYLQSEFGGDRSRFVEGLRQQGRTEREFMREFEDKMIVGAMQAKMRRSQATVSPAKIEAWYEAHRNDYLQEEAVQIRQIVLAPQAVRPLEARRAQARQICSSVDGGQSIEDAARAAGATVTRPSWFQREELRRELAEAAFALKKGEHSEPLTLGEQITIVFVLDRREKGLQPLEAVRGQIESTLAAQLEREDQEKWLQRLRNRASVQCYTLTEKAPQKG